VNVWPLVTPLRREKNPPLVPLRLPAKRLLQAKPM
jgi:hypothetical protein